MDEAQGGREQGLEPDGAVRRLGEGQPLVLHILWIVVRDDHVDGAVGQRLDHRLPVVLVAQRRRELQEGAVIADVVLVERQVVDGDAAGDRQPLRLRGAHDLGRIGAGDHGRVVAPAGEAHEADVALQHHRLGLARDAGQPEPRGELALVHHALADEVGILHMVDDQRVEIAGVGQRAAHDLRIGDRARAIRERDGAGLPEAADLRHLLPFQSLGQGGGRADVDDGGVAGAAHDEVDDGRIVENRARVGHGDDGRDTARRRRLAGALEGLAIGPARLADEGAHVDEAGASTWPPQSITCASAACTTCGPTAWITPSRTSTPPRSSRSPAGSMRRAFFSRMGLSAGITGGLLSLSPLRERVACEAGRERGRVRLQSLGARCQERDCRCRA